MQSVKLDKLVLPEITQAREYMVDFLEYRAKIRH